MPPSLAGMLGLPAAVSTPAPPLASPPVAEPPVVEPPEPPVVVDVGVPRAQRESVSVLAAGQQRSVMFSASSPLLTHVNPLSQSKSPFFAKSQRSPSPCCEQAGADRTAMADTNASTAKERSAEGMTSGVLTPNPGGLQPPFRP